VRLTPCVELETMTLLMMFVTDETRAASDP
jgi:hypothetical protein